MRRRRPRRPNGDLDLAWRRLVYDARDDLVPDPLGYRDFMTTRADIVANVRSRLADGYSPSSLLRMDVPKNDLAMRPGSIPLIEDRLVYTALVGSFAERADASLETEEVVPSFRVQVGRRRNLFRFGVKQWFKFQDLMRQHYNAGYRYVLLTDLTAYFDHINHDLLIGQLRSLGVTRSSLSLLATLLAHWSGGEGIGIPQGMAPSSLLGNVYLDPLDKHMTRSNYHYFRYVDDIRVFAHSKSELQRAMLDIIRQTRLLGLHVQTAKTRIVHGDAILDLVNERQTQLAAIDYHLELGDTTMAVNEIRSVLRDLMRRGRFDERHFRKCLNGLGKAHSSRGVAQTLRKLDELKPWAQSVAEYLAPFVRSHTSIKHRLVDFIMDPERNVYEWPEFWFTRTLRGSATLPRPFLDWCRARLQDPKCHWNCRGQYALLLGAHGDLTDMRLLRSLIASRDNDYERRAFVVSLKNLPEPEKGNTLRHMRRDYPAVGAALALTAR